MLNYFRCERKKRAGAGHRPRRAVPRVARPEGDGYRRTIRRHGTAAHVGRLVRTWRTVESPEAQIRAHDARVCEWRYDAHNGIVIRARLPLAEGARVVKAPEAARAAIEHEVRPAVHDDVEPWPGRDAHLRARVGEGKDSGVSNAAPAPTDDDDVQWRIPVGAHGAADEGKNDHDAGRSGHAPESDSAEALPPRAPASDGRPTASAGDRAPALAVLASLTTGAGKSST